MARPFRKWKGRRDFYSWHRNIYGLENNFWLSETFITEGVWAHIQRKLLSFGKFNLDFVYSRDVCMQNLLMYVRVVGPVEGLFHFDAKHASISVVLRVL